MQENRTKDDNLITANSPVTCTISHSLTWILHRLRATDLWTSNLDRIRHLHSHLSGGKLHKKWGSPENHWAEFLCYYFINRLTLFKTKLIWVTGCLVTNLHHSDLCYYTDSPRQVSLLPDLQCKTLTPKVVDKHGPSTALARQALLTKTTRLFLWGH